MQAQSKMNLFKLLVMIVGGIFAGAHTSSFSGELVFHCTVKQYLVVSEAGKLIEKSGYAVGTQFVINQENGTITGRIVSTSFAESILIIDKGRVNYNNFRVSGIIKHWHPTHFYIEVFTASPRLNPGTDTIPFSGYFNYGHIAGTCTEF
jgi:hypothetical protein